MTDTTAADTEPTLPTVLLVDDDANFLDALRRQFRDLRHKWRVLTAPDGAAALRVLQTEPVAVVVTDILMPDLDGLGLIMELRKLDIDLKIITISGGGRHVGAEPLAYSQSLGADFVLPKPFEFTSLTSAIELCLDPSSPVPPTTRESL